MERHLERPECCIDRCLTKTKSIKVKDIIYYLFPTDAAWAKKWEKEIKEFDPTYKRKSNDVVCSLHFAKSSMIPVSRQLVDHALPVHFPQKATDAHQSKSSESVSVPKSLLSVPKSMSSVSKCCITGCPTKFNDSPKIHGFPFPDGSEQRKKWMFIIELYNNQKIEWEKSMKVCALHFASACFTQEDKLVDGSKPSIFKHAIVCRQKEIAKQQSNNQQPSSKKIQSINVPLHKQNADNHSMSRRSAPVIARRLSLPYSKLPPLAPKPNILKRTIPIQVDDVHVAGKLQRLSLPNGAVASGSKTVVNIIGKRPVPALTKVNVISNSQIVSKGDVSILRKSMPPMHANKLSPAILARIDNGTAKLIPVSNSSTAAHITRLPPTLKPAPRPIINAVPRTTRVETQIPKISRVQSIGKVQPVVKVNNTPMICKVPEITTNVSNPIVAECHNPDAMIVIEDGEAERNMAIKTSEEIDVTNTVATSKIGEQVQLYRIRDEKVFEYPRLLLERIREKQRINATLQTEVIKWKKAAIKLRQQYRMLNATTCTETIDIS